MSALFVVHLPEYFQISHDLLPISLKMVGGSEIASEITGYLNEMFDFELVWWK
ncbi:hypothetical protein [Paenibacillus cymbidii]|uniref:hypothetical protein n=1 Tax=Paenibacillus cymbidii TaxID=1639034 RepID=UPI0014368448|nr:hypothetical protein [Paenibacillus cymbidii]